MQIISFMAEKGGVGKTMLTFQLAKYLQSQKRNTLLIDLDLQKNLTGLFETRNTKFDNSYTVSNILENPKTPFKTLSAQNNIDIIPSHAGLAYTIKDLENKSGGDMRLLRWFSYNYNKLKNKYDFVLLDLPPGWNTAITNGILVSEKVISPLDPGFGGYSSFSKTKNAFQALQKDDDLSNPQTGESYITAKLYFLPNRIKYNTKLSRDFANALKDNPQVIGLIHEKELLNRSEMERKGARKSSEDHKQESKDKIFLDHLETIFNKIEKPV